MPYQAEVTPKGAQNILRGVIKLNEVEIHDGFKQYTSSTVEEWVKEHNLMSTTEIFLANLKCSTLDVLNSLFDDIARTIKDP